MDTAIRIHDDLRRVGRDAIRNEIADRAVMVLDERGFDETTVGQLAASVGISPRSFFRYFPTKEDVVIGDLMELGRLVEQELLARPGSETPWVALRNSFSPMVLSTESDPPKILRQARVGLSTPGLRARAVERHETWSAFLAPIVAQRLHDTSVGGMLAARALTQSALACLYVATSCWVELNGREPFGELLDATFRSVRALGE
jgi:AcrR family transcriptional regulator